MPFLLDDFGAGFGSFYYLKHLPFDYLKVDGEYVRHCATNETDRILISGVVQIARGMGKHTIAEFVGDQETARRSPCRSRSTRWRSCGIGMSATRTRR